MSNTKQQQAAASLTGREMSSTVQKSAPIKPRAVLTKTEVIAIFQIKGTQSATKVSRCFGVSEKAIRDIWTARTWAAETWHLDTSRPLNIKSSDGSPLGCRDSKPRQNRRQDSTRCRGTVSLADKKSSRDPIPRIYPCFVGEQISACLDVNLCDWPPHSSPACTVIPPSDQKPRSVQAWSLDEQLFDWEHGLVRYLPDPFEADWSESALDN